MQDSNGMYRFGKFLSLLFIGIVVALVITDVANSFLVRSSKSNNAWRMERLFQRFPRGEIGVFGDSRAFEHIIPSLISPNAFNYGIAGSSMRETLIHLESFLSRDDDGAALVNLELTGLSSFSQRGDYRFVWDDEIVMKNSDFVKIPFLDRIVGIRYAFSLRKNMQESDFINKVLGAKTKVFDNGSVTQRGVKTRAEWDRVIAVTTFWDYLKVDSLVKEKLEALLQGNKTHRIVFFVSPMPSEWRHHYKAFAELKAIKEWLATFPMVTVVDYSCDDRFEYTDFADPLHLNYSGAKKFCMFLKEDVGL